MTPESVSVLVLMGGPDAEREVSIMSGREVAEALRRAGRFDVIEQIIDTPTPSEISAMGGEIVFPVLHGRWGEGGPLQQVLEQAGAPYVGSGPEASALAMDKLKTKHLLAKDGMPTPPAQELLSGDSLQLQPPTVIKPIDDGSSVDLHICRNEAQVVAARQALHPKRGRLLAERYVKGREVTVGIVLGRALPLIEIVPSEAVEFYDYQAKYFRDDTRYRLHPALPPGVSEQCAKLALMAFGALGCRDVARVDFMIDDAGPWFLELNTMPGFTTHSLVPMAASEAGMNMAALCAALVDAALKRTELVSASAGASGKRSI